MGEAAMVLPPAGPARDETGLADPIRQTDRRIIAIVRLMVNREWSPDRGERLALEWGISARTVEDYATEAGRIIRLCTDPEAVHEWALTRLREFVEDERVGPFGPVVSTKTKIEAIKLTLEATGAVTSAGEARRLAKRAIDAPLDPVEHFRALLRDPPPELEAILVEEWGGRTVVR